MLTNPVSRLNVVRTNILRERRNLSLLRCEEPLLPFRDFVEPLGGFFPFSPDGTILQLI
jgi:hypothetical protein